MDRKEFFYKVATLRRCQKEYFATRSREALSQAKALEKEIDAEIDRVNKIFNKQSVPPSNNLFGYDNC